MRPRLAHPVVGVPPKVAIGQPVWCLTVDDQWVLRLVSGLPRPNGLGPTAPTVHTVLGRDPFFDSGERAHEDWPLADILPENGSAPHA